MRTTTVTTMTVDGVFYVTTTEALGASQGGSRRAPVDLNIDDARRLTDAHRFDLLADAARNRDITSRSIREG